jgi:hypothetical protein
MVFVIHTVYLGTQRQDRDPVHMHSLYKFLHRTELATYRLGTYLEIKKSILIKILFRGPHVLPRTTQPPYTGMHIHMLIPDWLGTGTPLVPVSHDSGDKNSVSLSHPVKWTHMRHKEYSL